MRKTRTILMSLVAVLVVAMLGAGDARAQCEVGSVTFQNSTTFSWNALSGTCPSTYDVSFGQLVFVFASPVPQVLGCLADNSNLLTQVDAAVPAVGSGLCYLVRANNGTWDETSSTQVGTRDLNPLSVTCPF